MPWWATVREPFPNQPRVQDDKTLLPRGSNETATRQQYGVRQEQRELWAP